MKINAFQYNWNTKKFSKQEVVPKCFQKILSVCKIYANIGDAIFVDFKTISKKKIY